MRKQSAATRKETVGHTHLGLLLRFFLFSFLLLLLLLLLTKWVELGCALQLPLFQALCNPLFTVLLSSNGPDRTLKQVPYLTVRILNREAASSTSDAAFSLAEQTKTWTFFRVWVLP